jgi:hypothetical protein
VTSAFYAISILFDISGIDSLQHNKGFLKNYFETCFARKKMEEELKKKKAAEEEEKRKADLEAEKVSGLQFFSVFGSFSILLIFSF